MCTTRMSIVFASSKGYVEHLAVAMYSLFENNQELPMDVYVLNADIDPDTWGELEKTAEQFGSHLIDLKVLDRDFDHLVLSHHFTKETYYRLLIPEKINVSKALYLDVDIVVTGSISGLYNMNVDDFYLAAANTPGFVAHEDLEMPDGAKYFNAGVMLINVARWRQEHLKERVIDLVRSKPWAIQFADQCGLNSIVDGRWIELHPKFNLQSFFFEVGIDPYLPFFPNGELTAAIHSPVIVHYSGSSKPWHFGYQHPYRNLYWKYLRKTPFNHLFSRDLTITKLAKRCVPQVIKRHVKMYFSKNIQVA
jgi:lipopolysaccharide biosynthesis glycosyltransferase